MIRGRYLWGREVARVRLLIGGDERRGRRRRHLRLRGRWGPHGPACTVLACELRCDLLACSSVIRRRPVIRLLDLFAG